MGRRFGDETTFELLDQEDLLRELGAKKRLGCGGEGCVFLTRRGTVLRLHSSQAVEQPLNDVLLTKMLHGWQGEHPAIPVIYAFGRIDDPFGNFTIAIEREPLEDIDHIHGFFSDPHSASRTVQGVIEPWLEDEGVTEDEVRRVARGNPIAEQVVDALVWLRARGVEPQDVSISRNWGRRQDGTVAVRDWSLFTLDLEDHPELAPFDLFSEGADSETLDNRFDQLPKFQPAANRGQLGGVMARNQISGPLNRELGVELMFYDPEGSSSWPRNYASGGALAVVIPPYLSGGDYAGNDGGISRANVDSFSEEYGELEDSYWWSIRGDYGSFGIAVRADAYEASRGTDEESTVDSMLETLLHLTEYPLINEEAHSELELRQTDGDWDDHGRAEFIEMMTELLPTELTEDVSYDTDALFTVYRMLGEQFGIYPEIEGSGDNLNTVFHFDQLKGSLEPVLAAWNVNGDNILARQIDAVMRGEMPASHIEYGGHINKVIRYTSNIVRSRGGVQVFGDWVMANGPEKAYQIAQSGGTFAGFGEPPVPAGWWAVWYREGMNAQGEVILMREGVFPTEGEARDYAMNLNRQPGIDAWVQPASEDPRPPRDMFSGLIPGGTSAGDLPDSRFDPRQLRAGTEVELEHTSDRRVAKEIAKAHLMERPDYYVQLARMEAEPIAKGFAGGDGQPPAALVRQYIEAAAKNKFAAQGNAPIKTQQRFYDRYMKLRMKLADGWPHIDLDDGIDNAIARWREQHPLFGPGAGW